MLAWILLSKRTDWRDKSHHSRWATAYPEESSGEAAEEVAVPMRRKVYLEDPSNGFSQKIRDDLH